MAEPFDPLHDPVAEDEFHKELLMAGARGHKQRASVSSGSRAPAGGGDPEYADNLLCKWSYGLFSATLVSEQAILSFKAGARGGYLQALTMLGTSGGNKGHIAADLMELIRKIRGTALIPMYVALVPFFVAKDDGGFPSPELCSAGFLLPHVWFAFMYKHHRKEFFLRLIGCRSHLCRQKLKDFWAAVHPANPRKRPELEAVDSISERCVPLGCHDDEAPITKRDSLGVLSLFETLGVGTTVEMAFSCSRTL